jgi:DNA-binding XRE family transcriptional regulator
MTLKIITDSPLSHIMGVDEASSIWNLSAGYIKNLCADGKIAAKKIGKTWVIDKNQMNPSIPIQNGKKLKALRLDSGLSQAELCSKLENIRPHQLSKIESGIKILSSSQEKAVCDFFNLPNDYFQ